MLTNAANRLYAIKENAKESKDLAEWILNIGEGTKAIDIGNGRANLKLSHDIIMREEPNSIRAVVENTYHGMFRSPSDPEIFKDRAIIASTNEMVDKINEYAMSLIPAKETVYLSSDNICHGIREFVRDNDEAFSVENLNMIKCSGFPNHEIKLKEGCIVMLLKDVDRSDQLYKGTRMMVTKLDDDLIEACRISGNNAGKKCMIARTKMCTSKFNKFPIRVQRIQFPFAVCYAMTINKSRGQSLSSVGLYVPKSVFSVDQLCNAISRIVGTKGLNVLICDESGKIYHKLQH